MSDKIFIDTNLLIYSCSDNQVKKDIASSILLSHSELHLSVQVINEFLAVATNKLKMSVDEAISNAEIFMGVYTTHSIHTTTVINSFKIIKRYQYSNWDSLIIASALENDCEILFSEDMQHNQIIENKLKIINPFK